jgi:hypothetical protein
MDRRVRAIKKDRNGAIIALCNAGESWSPRRKADVVKDIVENKRSYYVQEVSPRAYIRVANGNSLVTTSNAASSNQLERLPSE